MGARRGAAAAPGSGGAAPFDPSVPRPDARVPPAVWPPNTRRAVVAAALPHTTRAAVRPASRFSQRQCLGFPFRAAHPNTRSPRSRAAAAARPRAARPSPPQPRAAGPRGLLPQPRPLRGRRCGRPRALARRAAPQARTPTPGTDPAADPAPGLPKPPAPFLRRAHTPGLPPPLLHRGPRSQRRVSPQPVRPRCALPTPPPRLPFYLFLASARPSRDAFFERGAACALPRARAPRQARPAALAWRTRAPVAPARRGALPTPQRDAAAPRPPLAQARAASPCAALNPAHADRPTDRPTDARQSPDDVGGRGALTRRPGRIPHGHS
jgi:hypothetical protein